MASPHVSPHGATAWRTGWFAAVVLFGTAMLAYHNTFAVPFVFDDDKVIYANPSIHSLVTSLLPPQQAELGGLPISGRPVVNFSIALNYRLSGTRVGSYHVFNFVIHALCGLLLFSLLRRTLVTPRLASRFGAHAFELSLVIALIWTLHPLQTESVTYISQRAESLAGLMYFLTLWCYVRAVDTGARSWALGAVVACLLGMATKEILVSAPLIAAIYDRVFLSNSWREVWSQRKRLLLGLAATWLLLVVIVALAGGRRGESAGFGLGVSSWTYLLTQCEALVMYLKLCFWPSPLVLDYGTRLVQHASVVWWQGLLLLALAGATVCSLFRRPAVGLTGLWFFLILAPSSSVIPLVGQTMAEHRMYLPLAAVVILTVLLLYGLLGRRALWQLALLCIPLTAATVRRNTDYATRIKICEDTVAKQPANARAMALLADYHRQEGHFDQARVWLERSLTVQPGIVPVLNNLGNVWQELGDVDRAIALYRQAVASAPHDLNALNNLGAALVLSGKTDEGIGFIQAALAQDPSSLATRSNLANALARSGRLAEAVEHFAVLAQTQPDSADAHLNYSDALYGLGRREEATAELERAVRMKPQDAMLHNQLGAAFARSGRMRDALQEFEAALRLDPSNSSARANAERARARLESP